MTISLKEQMKNPSVPLQPVYTFADSSLPVAIVDVPFCREDGLVTGVWMTVTNADGMPCRAPALKCGPAWRVAFAPGVFDHVGFIARGVKIDLVLSDGDGHESLSTAGVGDIDIMPTATNVTPGDASRTFVLKGSDIYCKSEIIGDVQHYKKQAIVFDAEMGAWGAEWTGDYILNDGEYVDASSAQEDTNDAT